jgi:LysR family transcriptional regulator, hydrogen peroxide-inducible genes activator
MQVQHIRYFLALEELNFTRAARRCGVSQPSLTCCIRRLETQLGGPLFTRKPKVSVTPLGRAMAPYLARVSRDIELALHAARSLHKGGTNGSETHDREFVHQRLRADR